MTTYMTIEETLRPLTEKAFELHEKNHEWREIFTDGYLISCFAILSDEGKEFEELKEILLKTAKEFLLDEQIENFLIEPKINSCLSADAFETMAEQIICLYRGNMERYAEISKAL